MFPTIWGEASALLTGDDDIAGSICWFLSGKPGYAAKLGQEHIPLIG